jgi:hypothetical protein
MKGLSQASRDYIRQLELTLMAAIEEPVPGVFSTASLERDFPQFSKLNKANQDTILKLRADNPKLSKAERRGIVNELLQKQERDKPKKPKRPKRPAGPPPTTPKPPAGPPPATRRPRTGRPKTGSGLKKTNKINLMIGSAVAGNNNKAMLRKIN